jgi:hypothetical protein
MLPLLLLRRLLLPLPPPPRSGPSGSAGAGGGGKARVAPAPSPSSSPTPPASPCLFSPDVTPRLGGTAAPDPPAPDPPPPRPLRVHVATFNAAGLSPGPGELLPPAFCGFARSEEEVEDEADGGDSSAIQQGGDMIRPPPDLLFVCTQETGGSTSAWERCVLRSLAAALPPQPHHHPPGGTSSSPPSSYRVVARRTLRGGVLGGGMVLHAAAFASSSLRLLEAARSASVATGLLNVVGNKGGAALDLTVARRPWPALPLLPVAGLAQGSGRHHKRWSFFRGRGGSGGSGGGGGENNNKAPGPRARLVLVGAHLAAHEGRAARRNADAARIARGIGRAFGGGGAPGWLRGGGGDGDEEEDEGEGDEEARPFPLLLSEAARRAEAASGCGRGLLSLLLLCGGGRRRRRRGSGRVAPWPPQPPATAARRPPPGVVIWAGDLNYRAAPGGAAEALALAEEEEEEEGEDDGASARRRCRQEKWASLAADVDELTRERWTGLQGGCTALRGYNEAPLAFAPTFKLERRMAAAAGWAAAVSGERGGCRWPCRRVPPAGLTRLPTDSGAPLLLHHTNNPRYSRKRSASWTDRVLWREVGGGGGGSKPLPVVRQLYYGPVRADGAERSSSSSSSVLERSDHRAVVAGFEVALG